MSDIDDPFGADNAPQGEGIKGLNLARQQGFGQLDRPFMELWKTTPGFQYQLRPGEQGELIFLTEPKILLGFPILHSWNPWPKTTPVATRAYRVDHEGMLEPDPITVAFGFDRPPKLYICAVVLDRKPWFRKDKRTQELVEVKNTIRFWITASESVRNQLDLSLKANVRGPATGTYFMAQRSNDKRSDRVGDTYMFTGRRVALKDIWDRAPKLKEEFEKFDLQGRTKYPGDDLVIRMLRHHKRLKDQHPESTSYGYDADGMAAVLNGTWKHMTPGNRVLDDFTESTPVVSAGAQVRTSGDSLDFLDDDPAPVSTASSAELDNPFSDDEPTAEPEAEDDPFEAASTYDDDDSRGD